MDKTERELLLSYFMIKEAILKEQLMVLDLIKINVAVNDETGKAFHNGEYAAYERILKMVCKKIDQIRGITDESEEFDEKNNQDSL